MSRVWLVTAAHGRYDVTRIALAQWQHLATVLEGRGVECRQVVVANDENLDIAREHGCDTVELDNHGGLGRRFHAGFRHAAGQGADYFVYLGSDDWIHPDLLDPLPPPGVIVTGRRISFVHLPTGRLQVS